MKYGLVVVDTDLTQLENQGSRIDNIVQPVETIHRMGCNTLGLDVSLNIALCKPTIAD